MMESWHVSHIKRIIASRLKFEESEEVRPQPDGYNSVFGKANPSPVDESGNGLNCRFGSPIWLR